MAREVMRVMNEVLEGGPAPDEWMTAHIVGIPKKPGTVRKEEHRGISLMSCTAKLFNKVLLTWLQPVLDPFCSLSKMGSSHSEALCHRLSHFSVSSRKRAFTSQT